MINEEYNFKNLIELDFKNYYINKFDKIFDNFSFKGELSFRNILNFHIDIVKKIIKKQNRNVDDFNFYIANFTDINETITVYNDILDSIILNKKKELILPDIINNMKEKLKKFNTYFDIKILYYDINNKKFN
jgi:hypothetical protein